MVGNGNTCHLRTWFIWAVSRTGNMTENFVDHRSLSVLRSHYLVQRPPRAWTHRTLGDTQTKNKSLLPVLCFCEFGKCRFKAVAPPKHRGPVNPFDGLIERLCSEPFGGHGQMQPLPRASGLYCCAHVEAVAY